MRDFGCMLLGYVSRATTITSIILQFWEEPSMDQYQCRGETLEELSGPLVHTNFPRRRYGPMIGPYEFPQEKVWTNGAQSSLKVSVLTGIGP